MSNLPLNKTKYAYAVVYDGKLDSKVYSRKADAKRYASKRGTLVTFELVPVEWESKEDKK